MRAPYANTKFRDDIVLSSLLTNCVVDLTYLASFRNAGDSKASVNVENLCQILHNQALPTTEFLVYIQLYSPIYMVAEIRKTTEKKKVRNLAIAPMTSIP